MAIAPHPVSQPDCTPTGFVSIVGAGPGLPDYLTLQGRSRLERAEAVVYDALVSPELLDLSPASCQRIHVGKRGGQPSLKQSEIDRLLVDLCQQGLQVVRLKSGDPFIFGRTASEIQALNAAGCRFEVVPGISSALAGPLLASIPLTDPVLSRSFAVVSAHEPDALNWPALAGIDTLVVLMGTQQLAVVVERLIANGRSPHTPIAIIRWAGHPQQQVWTSTLEAVVRQTAHEALSPAVITIGEVVALRPYLAPPSLAQNGVSSIPSSPATAPVSDSTLQIHSPADQPMPLPLSGKTVIVTRAAGQSSSFTQLLQAQGATVLEMPTLEIGPPSSWDALDGAIAHLPKFHWLILTSTNGVDAFFQRLFAQNQDSRSLNGIKIAVVGQKTAAQLQHYGIQPDFIPPDFVADALVEHFPEPLQGLNILFPRVETGGRDVLVQAFTHSGAAVVEVPAYESGCAKAIAAEVQHAFQNQNVDIITFASSKTVHCFKQLFTAFCQTLDTNPSLLSSSICLASIGPQTSQACQAAFGRVDIEAEEYTLEGLTQALVKWAKSS
ncbi:uroporphyrinogen-III C-methyltransferase [Leptolyngbya sp. O-77]|uniref:uroporphyrinogen-III C-methyltransferase n=1 Tax=Leptolyngbya sp. O-77 TaxID=1080068 RepID=UPI00074D4613|nr:uroporphyrinogen-III C-methyltransferase [Leptolyngbya sp. O-77]BAU40461.1 Uroporphyrinogen-III C-methyltransferase [Leptolyngbya sp. O-77]